MREAGSGADRKPMEGWGGEGEEGREWPPILWSDVPCLMQCLRDKDSHVVRGLQESEAQYAGKCEHGYCDIGMTYGDLGVHAIK